MPLNFSTVRSLKTDLGRLGVAAGSGLFVQASLGSIGPVIGGARAVVSALIDTVGADGLIGMPGFSSDASVPSDIEIHQSSEPERREIVDAILGFDSRISPTSGMGAIAEIFRTWPDTLRSSHPCVSICLRGDDADRFIAPHTLAWAQVTRDASWTSSLSSGNENPPPRRRLEQVYGTAYGRNVGSV